MFETASLLPLIPLLPLLAAVLTAFVGPKLLRQHSHWPCILGAIGACILAFLVLADVLQSEGTTIHRYYTWFRAGTVDIGFTLRADGLTAIMLVTVTFIGSLIAMYSIGYMHGDPGYPRFFAEIALFLASMTGLVLADNFVLMYGFWEGVGLCSYLLIGFWFAKPSAAAAARKAFLVTRLGDLGLFIGILLIWSQFVGETGQPLYSLNFEDVFRNATLPANQPLLTVVCLLLFCGAVGKSAQFPLHVWLPDAMEGPSPVSALIHAATMVTAGVYLVARSMPLFALAPDALLVVAAIGGFTALFASLMALTQTDLKRVLAYSTISQLGYMFLALGSATPGLVTVAVTAAIFHLFTHAFFKALLFLSAGSVMHAMGGIIDMRRFRGLRHVLPITHWTFLCGGAALAGVPLLSGFWSKDEILSDALEAGGAGMPHAAVYRLLFAIGVFTAGLTAFYTFRAYFLTFWGEERIPPEAGHHAHEAPPVMTVPLMILAVGAVAIGFIVGPMTHSLDYLLEHHWIQQSLAGVIDAHHEHGHTLNWTVMTSGSLFALGGIFIAYWMYRVRSDVPEKLARAAPAAYEASKNRFYIDEIYDIFVVKPLTVLALLCRFIDQWVVDGLVDLVGEIPALVGEKFRPIQNGLVQLYGLVMVLAVAGFLIALLMR
jgi:proton-translocating NADH-quinone oxidoreductase chain L